ncbi:hypothetical protein ACLD02_00005 [Alloalcanivorax sp. C16-2]|uniref:hypothetical protein n=1 Tax=Alloalcanivorax TaxID=3020832 RepID=UPI00193250BA|nr:hypothetical protein [Alloalcanivorax marinus]MBL7252131.1 hypothetical protein [Alloalcanivorax marinus]
MNKALIPFAIAALSAAPLSVAQADDYLAQRQNLDSFEQIQASYQEAVAQGQRARAAGNDQGAPRDYLAQRLNQDQAQFIAAEYRDLEAQQEVVKAEGNPAGAGRDYLNERQNLDSPQHISEVLSNLGQS